MSVQNVARNLQFDDKRMIEASENSLFIENMRSLAFFENSRYVHCFEGVEALANRMLDELNAAKAAFADRADWL